MNGDGSDRGYKEVASRSPVVLKLFCFLVVWSLRKATHLIKLYRSIYTIAHKLE